MTKAEKSAVVEMSGEKSGAGTGFFAKLNGKVFLITNVHVIAGLAEPRAKTVTGEEIPVKKVFTARNHDIAIVPLNAVPDGCAVLEIENKVQDSVKEGDKIVVYGNSLGSHTMLETRGSVLALGSNLIELDCPFFSGNSGSPVFHLSTRKVVSVVSYVSTYKSLSDTNTASRNDSKSAIKKDTRYFSYRLDSIKKWDASDPRELMRQSELFDGYKKKIGGIVEFLNDSSNTSRDVEFAYYPDLYNVIQTFRNDCEAKKHPLTRRVAVKDMIMRIIQLCKNESNRLKSAQILGTFETERKQLIGAFDEIADTVEKNYGNM